MNHIAKFLKKELQEKKISSIDNHTEVFFSSFKRLYKNPLPITLSKWQDLQKIKKSSAKRYPSLL